MYSVSIMAGLEDLVFETLWKNYSQLSPRLMRHSLSAQDPLIVNTESLFEVEVFDNMGVRELFPENSNFRPVSGLHKSVDLT